MFWLRRSLSKSDKTTRRRSASATLKVPTATAAAGRYECVTMHARRQDEKTSEVVAKELKRPHILMTQKLNQFSIDSMNASEQ